ncbi:hypothetical protein TNCV_1972951 [Trichonephila clavipes]|nr:hypothetical protein TNCV_1972951 [Trichonephila clavipes]
MDGQEVQTVIRGFSPWQPPRCETVLCLGETGFSFSINMAVFLQVLPSACQVMMRSMLLRVMNWSPDPRSVVVAEWSRYRIVASLITISSPVSLKTRRVGKRYTLNLPRARTSFRWCEVVVRIPAQVSSMSLDYGSKLLGPLPKALV